MKKKEKNMRSSNKYILFLTTIFVCASLIIPAQVEAGIFSRLSDLINVRSSSPTNPGDHRISIVHDGLTRNYILYVPSAYITKYKNNELKVPVVFDFHGHHSTPLSARYNSGILEVSGREGFIVVYPEGLGPIANRSFNGEICCGYAVENDIDDVGYVLAVLDDVKEKFNYMIDEKRVYTTGKSNGGIMSHKLACDAADVFAAAAPVVGPFGMECNPSRNIPIKMFYGSDDYIVKYDGSRGILTPSSMDPFISAEESFMTWAELNGCSIEEGEEPEVTYTSSSGASYCETYVQCGEEGEDVEVTMCTVKGGHSLSANIDGVNIAEQAWEFLSKYTLPDIGDEPEDPEDPEDPPEEPPVEDDTNPFTEFLLLFRRIFGR